MKYQTFFVVALLLIAFTSSAYAAQTEPAKGLNEITMTCLQDIYEGLQLCYSAYEAIMNNNIVALIGIINQAQTLYTKACEDCATQVIKLFK